MYKYIYKMSTSDIQRRFFGRHANYFNKILSGIMCIKNFLPERLF